MPPVVAAVAAVAAVGAVVGAVVGTATIASVALTVAGNLVLGRLSTALAGRPRAPAQPSFIAEASERTQLIRTAIGTRQIVYGEAATSGPLLFAASSGASKEFLHIVVPVAGHEVAAIDAVYFNDTLSTDGRFAGLHRVNKALGGDAQAADADLAAEVPEWTANHRLRGVAYVYARLQWSAEAWPTGLPNLRAVVRGRKVFDPRDGATRWSNNPALCIRDYLTADFGLGASAAEIDDASFIAAANICDEAVALAGGGTQKRYTCGGVIDLAHKPIDLMEGLLTACAGVLVYQQGAYRLHAGAATAATFVLDESDLRAPLRLRPRQPRRDLYNAVRGSFVDPAQFWQPTEFPPLVNAAYEAEDGGQRIFRDIELPFTSDPVTAQRLAKIHLEKSRQGLSVEFPAKPTALNIAVWDVVTLNIAALGWAAKEFRVLGWQLSPDGGVDLTLQEESAAAYAWSAGDASTVDAAPNTTLPNPFVARAPTGLALASGTAQLYTRLDGTVFSRIKASWTPPADAFVTSGGRIEVQHKKTADAVWQPSQFAPGDAAAAYILDVQDGQAYDVRIRAVNGIGVASAWAAAANHAVVGKTAPPSDVGGFTAAPNGALVVFRWQAVPDLDVAGYTIRYGAAGLPWTAMTELTQATRGTQITTAAVPPGTWRFAIKARDTSGNESANTATSELAVGNANSVIAAPAQAPDWLGTKVDFVKHWAGVMVPDSTKAANQLTNAELFEAFVPYPKALCAYEAPEIDVGFDASIRVFATSGAALGRGVTAGLPSPSLDIDYRNEAGSYDGFEPWTIGTMAARRLKAKLVLQPALGNAYVSAFTPTADAPNRDDERGQDIAVASGGTAITFARRFFYPPNVQITPRGATAMIGVADNIAATGFTARLFDASGAGVAGSINWQALGS
jgi:Putative phage tail protein